MFAAVGSFQALSGFASPLYNIIYLNTMDFYLGTAYLIGLAFVVILLLILLYCFVTLRRTLTTRL